MLFDAFCGKQALSNAYRVNLNPWDGEVAAFGKVLFSKMYDICITCVIKVVMIQISRSSYGGTHSKQNKVRTEQ